jgi:Uma2 family endonuclease
MSVVPLQYEDDIFYPESDGQPMGESDLHRAEMSDLIDALQDRFRDAVDVYVSGNLFFYYEKGNPKAVICPDVFVVHGVPSRPRPIYKLWEEGRVPSMVIEVTSSSTRGEDLRTKKDRYERLGVEEYLLFDLLGDYLEPRLQGHRLSGGKYQPMRPAADGSLESRTTGLILRPEEKHLRLVDAATGKLLIRPKEARAALEEERSARLRAEDELTRLRRELELLKKA